MSFRDHFSDVSEGYSRYRPRYPAALFEWLAREAPSHDLAWDCATGSGQAAAGLAPWFQRVEATDASRQQIENAVPVAGVRFRVASADDSGLDAATTALVTVAQALHWFDLGRFFAEAERVLVDDGLLAVWCYQLCQVTPAIDAAILDFYRGEIDRYWPPERRHIEAGYDTLPMPWPRIPTPSFRMEAQWDVGHMLGYLGTWSAVQHCREATGRDPLAAIAGSLREHWGPGSRSVVWPLTLACCRRPPRDGVSPPDSACP